MQSMPIHHVCTSMRKLRALWSRPPYICHVSMADGEQSGFGKQLTGKMDTLIICRSVNSNSNMIYHYGKRGGTVIESAE